MLECEKQEDLGVHTALEEEREGALEESSFLHPLVCGPDTWGDLSLSGQGTER